VFINLLYTHTMPNNHYCSTYMMAYPHLIAKLFLCSLHTHIFDIFFCVFSY